MVWILRRMQILIYYLQPMKHPSTYQMFMSAELLLWITFMMKAMQYRD